MARSNIQRLQESILYIHQHVSSELALAVDRAARDSALTDDALGAALSLDGYKFWWHGSDGQHKALRALLLCQKLFLNAPFAVNPQGAPFTYNMFPDLPKTEYRGSSEQVIRTALRAYVVRNGATLAGLADKAENAGRPEGQTVWETLTRENFTLAANPICFDAVRMWLFQEGFVSIRWLAGLGPTLTAQTANQILGQGRVIRPDQLANIPRGQLFNFHVQQSQAVCHWGVSLGNGRAAAANTTKNFEGAAQAVSFISGDTHYGIFDMGESYEVCRYKYSQQPRTPTNVVIRQIDPSTVTTYF